MIWPKVLYQMLPQYGTTLEDSYLQKYMYNLQQKNYSKNVYNMKKKQTLTFINRKFTIMFCEH